MGRVAEPLARMGARFVLANGGTLPATIEGGALHGIRYEMPVPSAQVKSALLIAGTFADGETTVVERVPTRDHTETMLAAMGAASRARTAPCACAAAPRWKAFMSRSRAISPPRRFSWWVRFSYRVRACICRSPASIHAAPFCLEVLERMGATFSIDAVHTETGERAGDLTATHARLHAITINDPATIASIIDEIPILAVAATQAEGRTEFRNAAELRVKESDRVDAMVTNLRALGASVEAFEDGFAIDGPSRLRGTAVSSFGDHRVAMAMAVAGWSRKVAPRSTTRRSSSFLPAVLRRSAHVDSLENDVGRQQESPIRADRRSRGAQPFTLHHDRPGKRRGMSRIRRRFQGL